MNGPRRGVLAAWAAAGILALAALFLPWNALLDSLSSRYATVRNFRADFEAGFRILRLALLLNGAFAAALPWILRRCALSPDAAPFVNREDRLPAALLALAAAAVAAPGLFLSFQDDEWRGMEAYVRHGPGVILTRNPEGDNHVLYSLLCWPFYALFGFHELSARLPALLLGAPAPALLYLTLRARHSRRLAWLSSLPLCFFPFLVGYSHEGRAYAPLLSVFLLMALVQPRAMEGSRGAWWTYTAAALAAPALQAFGAVGVAAMAAGAFADRAWRAAAPAARNLGSLALAAGGSFLFLSLHLPRFLSASHVHRPPAVTGPAIAELFPGTTAGPLAPLLLVPFAVALGLGLARGRAGRALAAGFGAAVVLQWVLGQAAGPGHGIRFYVAALALGAVPVAEGLAVAMARRAGAALTALLLAISAAADVDYYRTGKRDYRAAAEAVRARRLPGESLGLIFDGRPLAHYLGEPVRILTTDEAADLKPDWFVAVDANVPPGSELSRWLDSECELVFRLPSFRGEIRGYRRRS